MPFKHCHLSFLSPPCNHDSTYACISTRLKYSLLCSAHPDIIVDNICRTNKLSVSKTMATFRAVVKQIHGVLVSLRAFLLENQCTNNIPFTVTTEFRSTSSGPNWVFVLSVCVV